MKANVPLDPGHNGPQRPLPKPNASMKPGDSGTNFTEAEIRGLIANPIYAGIGPFPQLVSDEQWVRAAVKAIQEDGPEQFLVNLLHVLRQSLAQAKVVA
jgi:hypothetical protein